MGKGTSIQWCDDTVNPTSGCDGCELWTKLAQNFYPELDDQGTLAKIKRYQADIKAANLTPHDLGNHSCYAGIFHELRLALSQPANYARDFFKVKLIAGRMRKALAARDLTGTSRSDKPWLDGLPRLIFVGDMGDIFSRAVPFEYLKTECVDGALSKQGQRHTQMWLTKRPARAVEFAQWLKTEHGIAWPENIAVGTSVTNQATTNRAELLAKHPAPFKYLSVEPLVEGVRFEPEILQAYRLVIVGGESGTGARPFSIAWARDLRNQCRNVLVPFFLKQMGSCPLDCAGCYSGGNWGWSAESKNPYALEIVKLRDSHGGDPAEWPEDLRDCREFPKLREAVSA